MNRFQSRTCRLCIAQKNSGQGTLAVAVEAATRSTAIKGFVVKAAPTTAQPPQ
ncbi:hypothetical protein EDC27_0445 [Desulfosoma caldarium]|uniref:Uncharacterized protein n=1 Tax=Desulfosoma caldarium TaxID=610254 RepID=A0A3N1VK51_9BACT|nr:hypothetical protein EDC27_0445 [Desulfosoma caldarium]